MEWQDWVLWIVVFVSLGGPVGALIADRVLGISGRLLLAVFTLPGMVAVAVIYAITAVDDRPLSGLIVWGFVGGVAGAAVLDVVRLIGVRLKAFPLDMPQLFGAIALGIAPRFQAHVMSELLSEVSQLPDDERKRAMMPRIAAIAAMPAGRRRTVASAMMHGLAHLPEERRQSMLRTQLGILAELPSERRVTVMGAMDRAMSAQQNGRGADTPLFAPPPRGLPKLPMGTFRRYAERAMPLTLQETHTPRWLLLLVGYTWHVIIGSTFGISYTLLFGAGSWALAFAWGTFIWAGMMVLMPPMMPLIRFPRWFPIVPLLAHLAMAAPIGYVALRFVDDEGHAASLAGAVVMHVARTVINLV